MRKHNKNQKITTPLNLAEATVYLLNLTILGAASLPFAVIQLSYAGQYDAVLRIGALGTFVLAFAATLIALRGQASRLLLWAVRFLVGVTCVALLYFAYGLARDLLGVRCIGLFGSTQTCVDSVVFALQFALTSPYVFIPVVLVFGTLAIIGLVQSLRKS